MSQRITEIPITIIGIEDDGFHLLVKGQINGLDANFLIDTGASRSVFDQTGILAFIGEVDFEENEKLSTGLGTNSMPSQVTNIKTIVFGDLMITDYTAIAIDLKHVSESYEKLGLPHIDGILGGDLLKRFRCVINYRTRKIKFYS